MLREAGERYQRDANEVIFFVKFFVVTAYLNFELIFTRLQCLISSSWNFQHLTKATKLNTLII